MKLNFQTLVGAELAFARTKYPAPFADARDGLAVVRDEYTETMVKVLKKRPANDVLHDLVQVAAMCQRTAEDCNMLDV